VNVPRSSLLRSAAGQLTLIGLEGVASRISRCLRCHRRLKDPESIRNGYGRVCRAKIQKPKKLEA